MATLATLRTQVRRDLHDLQTPQESSVECDSSVSTYSFPTLGPVLTGTFTVDMDGSTIDPANYTLYENGYVVLNTPPTGALLHAKWQFARWSNEDLNQFIQEALNEFSLVHPKFDTIRRTVKTSVQSAKLTIAYNPGDTQLQVNSTTGYDPIGLVTAANQVIYYYTSVDATHFLGVTVWNAGRSLIGDAAMSIGAVIIQDDNSVHGWIIDPTKTREVRRLEGHEPKDEFGIGTGWNEVSWWKWDETTGYLHIEFDFSQLTNGAAGTDSLDPIDVFQVWVATYWSIPSLDTDVLDIPAYATQPVSWLAAALASEAREIDRDLSYRERPGSDTTADPTGALIRTSDSMRKKWEKWVATQFRPMPMAHRRISIL